MISTICFLSDHLLFINRTILMAEKQNTQLIKTNQTMNSNNIQTPLNFLGTASFGVYGFVLATIVMLCQQWIHSLIQQLFSFLIFSVSLDKTEIYSRRLYQYILNNEKQTNVLCTSFSIGSKVHSGKTCVSNGYHYMYLPNSEFSRVTNEKTETNSPLWRMLSNYLFGVFVVVDICRSSSGGGPHNSPTFDNLYCFRWNRAKLERFIHKLNFTASESDTKSSEVVIYRCNSNSSNFQEFKINTRNKESIFISTHEEGKLVTSINENIVGDPIGGLISDVRNFLNSESHYLEHSIPHRRGYMFYGPPGTGKTSAVQVLASELNMNIYCIELGDPRGYSYGIDLISILKSIPKRSIILFEEIDRTYEKQLSVEEKNPNEQPNMPLAFRGNPQKSFGEFLSAIDGVYAPTGSIIIFTTNHLEKLDEALLRSGRVDVQLEFDLANKTNIEKIVKRFAKSLEDEQVTRVVEKIPDGKFSMCQIQSFLSAHCKLPFDQLIQKVEKVFEQ